MIINTNYEYKYSALFSLRIMNVNRNYEYKYSGYSLFGIAGGQVVDHTFVKFNLISY